MKAFKLLFLICSCLGLLGLLSRPGQAQSGPPTGVYRLTAKCQPGLCLDVVGFGNGNNTPVEIWNANHTSNQQWLVEDQGDGTYKIYAYSSQNSFQMLDDNNGSITDGTNVTTYEDNNDPSQRWIFQDTGGGWYRIIPSAAGAGGSATLDVRGGNGAADGATLNIYHYVGGSNQLFRLDWAGVSQILPNGKKGVGGRDPQTTALNCAWYYDWGSGEPADTPTKVEFVPMAWATTAVT